MFGQKTRGVLLMVALAAASLHAAFAAEFRPEKEPEWKREMRKKLEKRVSYEFFKTPLEEAIPILQRQAEVPLTFSVRADAVRRQRQVTDSGEDVDLAFALKVVLGQVRLDFVLREDGVYVFTREELGDEGEVGSTPEWEEDLRRRLQRKIGFEFVGTPLSEALYFFRTLTRINMILDPGALKKRGNTPITLKVTNELLRDAFDRVLEIARFDYALIDEAMFISTRERLAREFDRRAAVVRAEAALEAEAEPEWKRAIRRTLERKVTFEFVDTPMQESIQFLQTLTKTTIIMDPKAVEGRWATPITLRVNDMSLGLALRWILRLAGLRHTLKDEAVWISTPENVLAELRGRAKPKVEKPMPEWEREFRKLLQRKVSFEFVDTPLTEAIQFMMTLAKCGMIVDPRAVEFRGNTPINLKVSDMPLELALDWILRLADLEYALKDGAIFISTREIIARERKAGLIPGSPRKTLPGLEDLF